MIADAQLNGTGTPTVSGAEAHQSQSVGGTLRRKSDKDVVLETSSGKLLRFRLLPKTGFRDKDSKPFRDSLVHSVDNLVIYVDPDDVETVVSITVLKSANTSEREAASVRSKMRASLCRSPATLRRSGR